MPWRSREFVVKDCDSRLLSFGSKLESFLRLVHQYADHVPAVWGLLPT
jgi:hypothetical protein